MARRLKLLQYGVEHVNYLWAGAYRLRLVATDAFDTGTDPNVFLYLRGPVNPYTHEHDDYFQCVASPVDMSEYPVDTPNATSAYPFFRSSQITLDLRSVTLVDEVLEIIVREVDTLLKAMDLLENLTLLGEYDVGNPSGSSSSVSGSSSEG